MEEELIGVSSTTSHENVALKAPSSPIEEENGGAPEKKQFLKKGSRWAAVTSKISAPGTKPIKKDPKEAEKQTLQKSQQSREGTRRTGAVTPKATQQPSLVKENNRKPSTPSPPSMNRARRDNSTEQHRFSHHQSSSKKAASSLPYMEYIGNEEKHETDQFIKLENTLKTHYSENTTKPIFLSDPLFDDDQQSGSDNEGEEEEENGGFISQFVSPLDKLPNPFLDSVSEEEDDTPRTSGNRSNHTYSRKSPQFHPKTPNELLRESPSIIDIDPPHNSYMSMYEKKKSMQRQEGDDDTETDYQQESEEEEVQCNRPQRLVTKYFHSKPSDKAKKKKEKIKQKKLEKEEERQKQRDAEELKELLNHYRAEKKRVQEMTDELLTERQKLNLEKKEFMQFKEREKEKFEQYKESEMKKINNEKRVIERQAKANQHFLSRREQEKEIEKLKHKINDMNQEFKSKEKNLKGTIEILKKKNEQMSSENSELKEELKRRELERIDSQFDQKSMSPVLTSNRYNSQEVEDSYESSDMNFCTSEELNWDQEVELYNKTDDSAAQEYKTKIDGTDTPISQYVQSLQEKYLIDYEEDIDSNLFEEEDDELDRVVSSTKLDGGQIAKKYLSGKVEVVHKNGTTKKSFPGQYTIFHFGNGDIKKTTPDNRTVYYYASANTIHISLPNGVEIYKFSNLQVERHYPDGTKEIIFPDETVKYIRPSGEEEIWFSDGTIQLTTVGRDRIITFPDGHRESKFRDGTVQIEYSDGRVKTVRE